MHARQRLFVVVTLAAALLACTKPMPPFREGTTAHGTFSKHDGHWILELDGTPEERGKAAGILVGSQVRWLLSAYLKKLVSTDHLSPAQKETVAAFAAGIPAAHFAELNALADAAGVERNALFAVNMAPEMLPSLACSCLATLPERSADGKVRLARNLDWPGGEVLRDAAIVLVEKGAAHTFASFTWPGLLAVATGMNDAGLSVADLMALGTGAGRPHPGLPVLFAVRGVLEEANDATAAVSWLKSAPRTMPQNYALADTTTAVAVETSSGYFRARPSEHGVAAITNYWKEEQGGAKDQRYPDIVKAAADGKLGANELEKILANVALPSMNIQSVVMEPATRTVFLAAGKVPVARGAWTSLDLSPWLRGPVR